MRSKDGAEWPSCYDDSGSRKGWLRHVRTGRLCAPCPGTPATHSEDADNALLQAVQGDLNREVPQALAPAVLIAEERNEILSKKGD